MPVDIAIWVYQPQLWLIIGIVFVLMELFNPTKIFFLPMGLSGAVMAVWVYLFNEGLLPHSWLPHTWYLVILQWALITLVFGIALGNLRKMRRGRKTREEQDINKY